MKFESSPETADEIENAAQVLASPRSTLRQHLLTADSLVIRSSDTMDLYGSPHESTPTTAGIFSANQTPQQLSETPVLSLSDTSREVAVKQSIPTMDRSSPPTPPSASESWTTPQKFLRPRRAAVCLRLPSRSPNRPQSPSSLSISEEPEYINEGSLGELSMAFEDPDNPWLTVIAEEASFATRSERAISHKEASTCPGKSEDRSTWMTPALNNDSQSTWIQNFDRIQDTKEMPFSPIDNSISSACKFGLYSIDSPPIDRRHSKRRRVYLIAAVVKLGCAIPVVAAAVYLATQLNRAYLNYTDILFQLATVISTLVLVTGAVIDLAVFCKAPEDVGDLYPRSPDSMEPYCIYGKVYFDSQYSKLLWLHSWCQKTAMSFGTLVVIAFVIPPSRWRCADCAPPEVRQQYAIYIVINCCMYLPLITQAIWWHWTWTVSAALAIFRTGSAVSVTAMSAKYVEGVAIVNQGGDADFDSLPADIRGQIAFLFTWFLMHGAIGGALAMVAALYSQVVNWKRSQLMVGIDALISLLVFTEQIVLLSSFNWLMRERNFVCNYSVIFGHESDFIKELCDSLSQHYRYGDMVVIVWLSVFGALAQCILRVLQLIFPSAKKGGVKGHQPLDLTLPSSLARVHTSRMGGSCDRRIPFGQRAASLWIVGVFQVAKSLMSGLSPRD